MPLQACNGTALTFTYNNSPRIHNVIKIITEYGLWTPRPWPAGHCTTLTWRRDPQSRPIAEEIWQMNLMNCHSKKWRSQASGHALTADYCVTMLLCFTIETYWLISVAEEARRMLNSGTLRFPWIYYQHSCELVSNAPHCLILTKRSKFLHLLSAPPSRHHQTVMLSYKCIVLSQANNLPFPECLFLWQCIDLARCHFVMRAYITRLIGTIPYSPATHPNDPQCDSGSFTDFLSNEGVM